MKQNEMNDQKTQMEAVEQQLATLAQQMAILAENISKVKTVQQQNLAPAEELPPSKGGKVSVQFKQWFEKFYVHGRKSSPAIDLMYAAWEECHKQRLQKRYQQSQIGKKWWANLPEEEKQRQRDVAKQNLKLSPKMITHLSNSS